MVQSVKCFHRKGILLILGKLQLNLEHIICTPRLGYAERRSIAESTLGCSTLLIKLLVPAIENNVTCTEKYVHDPVLNVDHRITFVSDPCSLLRTKHDCLRVSRLYKYS